MKEFGAVKQRDGLLSQADMLTFSHTGIPGAENIKAFGALRKSQPIPKPQQKETVTTAAAAIVASEATVKNNKEEDSRVENTRPSFTTIDGAQSDDDDDDGAVSQEVLLAVALQKSKRRQSGTGASTTARPTGSFADKLLGRALISPPRDTKIRNNDNKNAILSGSHHVPSLNARNMNNLALSSASEHSPRNSSHQQQQQESPSLVKRFSGMFSSAIATTAEPAPSTANASWNTTATNLSNHSMSGGSSSQHRPPMSPNPKNGTRASYNKTASLRSVLAASRGTTPANQAISAGAGAASSSTTSSGLTGSMRNLFRKKTVDGALSLLGGSLHTNDRTSPSPSSNNNNKPKITFGGNNAINLASYHASEHSDDEKEDRPGRKPCTTTRYIVDDYEDDDTDNNSFCEEVLSPRNSRQSDGYQPGTSMVLEASQETTLHHGSSSAISMQMSSSLSGDMESNLASLPNSINSKRNKGDSTSSQRSSFVMSMGQLPFGGGGEEEDTLE